MIIVSRFYIALFRRMYKPDEILEGKPQVCNVQLLGVETKDVDFDRLRPENVEVFLFASFTLYYL